MSKEVRTKNYNKDARDENFICDCGGTYVPVGLDGELKIFHCDKCWRGGQIECPRCHNPRTLIDRKNNMCKICSKALNKETEIMVAEACNQLFDQLVDEARKMVKSMHDSALKKTFTTN